MPIHLELPYRRAWSIILLIGHLAATTFHIFPRLAFPARPSTTAGVIAVSQQFGPVWVGLFGLASLCLIVGIVLNRGLHLAHGLGMAVWVSYSAALFTGAIVTSGTYFFPVVVFLVALMQGTCGWFYNEDAGRRARREHR